MKRVAFDVDSLVPYYVTGQMSGIGRATMELVRALDKMEQLPVQILLYSQNMKGIGARNLGTRFATKHLYLPFRPRVNKAISRLPLRQWLTGCDLYHIPHNFDYVHRPDKCIVTLHDALFFTCPQEAFNFEFARREYPRLARRCRGIITCSLSSKRDIVQYMNVPEEKIEVIPWGVNHSIFHPASPSTGTPATATAGERTFLCVSCSTGRKNTLNVIKAYALFMQRLAPADRPQAHRLTLVWNRPSTEVHALIRQHGIEDKVTFLAGIGDEALADLYRQASCFFFPSRYEGWGSPLLEALACGTPAVTCRNSSLPEVGGDAAYYVDPDGIEEMASYMQQFEEGTLLKADREAACLAQAARFSWERCAEQTVAYYTRSLGL